MMMIIIIITGLQVPESRIKDDVEKMKTIRDYEMICMLLQYQGTPQIAMDKFGGNSLDYQYFKSMFNTVAKKESK